MARAASTALVRLLQSSPLRHPRFRLFYFGSVGTALGYTMQATLAAWLMATLTTSTLMVALVQTASSTPALLLGLIAGSLADIVDRRRVLLAAQSVLLVSTAVLGVITLTGHIGPVVLLALTFLIGAGFTFYMPTQQAMLNDLVPHSELAPAVALGAIAFNVSRAVGPAIAGALAAWVGTGSTLLACALLFIGMIVAVRRVRRPPSAVAGIPETLFAGVFAGMRFVRHSPSIWALLQRVVTFSFCASAVMALLPVVARDQLGLSAGGFGLLFGCFGAGAVVAAFWLPRQLKRWSLQLMVNAGFALWAIGASLIAASSTVVVAMIGITLCGAAWVGTLATCSAGTQSSAPAWVRARALSMNLVSFQASMAVGSALWGWLASLIGLGYTLAASAACALLLMMLNQRARITLGQEAELKTGVQLPELAVVGEPLPDDGPVLIQIEYRIDPENRSAFLEAIQAMESTRRRNGASAWRIFRDLEDDDRFVERFVIASWAEYVRLRARVTMADQQLRERVQRLQRHGVPVRISRFIGIEAEQLAAAATGERDER